MKRLALSFIIPFCLAATGMAQEAGTATERLTRQGEQFRETIVSVAENVYTAVGFSVSNVSMIVGDGGLVIIDTGMTLTDAGRIAAEFRKISDKPVRAIIYTHSHGDQGRCPDPVGAKHGQCDCTKLLPYSRSRPSDCRALTPGFQATQSR